MYYARTIEPVIKEDQRNFSGIDCNRTTPGRQNHAIDKNGRNGSQNRFLR